MIVNLIHASPTSESIQNFSTAPSVETARIVTVSVVVDVLKPKAENQKSGLVYRPECLRSDKEGDDVSKR